MLKYNTDKNRKKLIVFHPALAPYRIDILNSFHKYFDTKFYFSNKNLNPFVSKNTSLKQIDQFFLKSIVVNGLKNRITTSYSGIKGHLIYMILLLSIPVMNFLPKEPVPPVTKIFLYLNIYLFYFLYINTSIKYLFKTIFKYFLSIFLLYLQFYSECFFLNQQKL